MTAKPAMDLCSYFKLKAVLAPRLRFNQTIYEGALTEHVHPGIVWLGAESYRSQPHGEQDIPGGGRSLTTVGTP